MRGAQQLDTEGREGRNRVCAAGQRGPFGAALCDRDARAAQHCEAEAFWQQHQACPTHSNVLKSKVPPTYRVHFILPSRNNRVQKNPQN